MRYPGTCGEREEFIDRKVSKDLKHTLLLFIVDSCLSILATQKRWKNKKETLNYHLINTEIKPKNPKYCNITLKDPNTATTNY